MKFKKLIQLFLWAIPSIGLTQTPTDTIIDFTKIAYSSDLSPTQVDSIIVKKRIKLPLFFGATQFEEKQGIEKIENNGNLLSIRQFFPNTKIISEEYIALEKDTFLYIKYGLDEHEIITKGQLIANICCESTDTIIQIDPYTYEQVASLVHYSKWSREGFWKGVYDNDLRMFGYYKNNVQVGEWVSYNAKNQKETYIEFNNKGEKINEMPVNVIETRDLTQIKNNLVGYWHLQRQEGESDKLRYVKTNKGDGELVFREDNYYHNVVNCFISDTKPNLNPFSLIYDKKQDKVFLKLANKPCILHYLSRYELIIEQLD